MATPTFKLSVEGLDLTLVEFDGTEELNRLFKYTFKTEIPSSGEKLADVIGGDAIFTIEEFDTSLHAGDIEIPGYISKASKTSGEWILEFLPKLKKTITNNRSEIYFKEDASLTALTVIQSEFDNDIFLNDRTPVFDILGTLPTRKLFCQFHESNWNYVARLCDHWGFHFYFDHYNSQIVFADNDQYDQKFTTQLKTTSATADNSQLKIVNWQEVGGNNAPITVVNKAEGRSTLELFLHHFALKNTQVKPHIVIGDNQQGIKSVAGNAAAIGYVSVGSAEYKAIHHVPIKLLPPDDILASVANVRNRRFPLSRPLNLITRESPTGIAKEFFEFTRSAHVNDLIEAQYFVPVAH